jgi:hypothetical protein
MILLTISGFGVRAHQRPARPVTQALLTELVIAVPPLVEALAADPVVAAGRRHIVRDFISVASTASPWRICVAALGRPSKPPLREPRPVNNLRQFFSELSPYIGEVGARVGDKRVVPRVS